MSHADPSARQLGSLHGSSLEAETSSDVPPPAEGALACEAPSCGRRGDAAGRNIDPVPSTTGHDGIGSPGTGGSRGKVTNETDAHEDVPSIPSEHERETTRALAVERLMAEADVGYDSVLRLREAGLTRPSNLAHVSKEQLRETFQLKFFEAERLYHLVRAYQTPDSGAIPNLIG